MALRSKVARRTVHPRVGGEHFASAMSPLRSSGSSPRGRGTPTGDLEAPDRIRFIPAWAGNTTVFPSQVIHPSVHPRVGGEHLSIFHCYSSKTGSSPRGRGTRFIPKTPTDSIRFIPAWAGNTLPRCDLCAPLPVHPRVGGEHYAAHWLPRRSTGSSPRGRGTPVSQFDPHPLNRFIPAWAGNTRHPCSESGSDPVHPRVGGEQPSSAVSLIAAAGSSPRGRGTPQNLYPIVQNNRFIPAWAGNTQ